MTIRNPGKPSESADAASRPAIIDGQAALDQALASLRVIEPDLVGRIMAEAGPPPLRLHPAGFAGLAPIIAGQQVSTASAKAIFGRLEASLVPLTGSGFLAMTAETLAPIGLSRGKIATLRAVAEAEAAGQLCFEALGIMPADEAHRRLVALKGIGPWTADSYLLFCLGHPDAWPAGDLALQEAARILLRLNARPDAAGLHHLGERWRPYRGVMARLLWAYYRVAKAGRSGMSLA